MEKKTVAVIFGGCSPEHEVSLKSAYSILKAIDSEKYEVILLGIDRQGQWFRYSGDIEEIFSDKWCEDTRYLKRAFISPERSGKLLEIEDGSVTFTAHSRFTNMIRGVGIEYAELVDMLIRLGLEG